MTVIFLYVERLVLLPSYTFVYEFISVIAHVHMYVFLCTCLCVCMRERDRERCLYMCADNQTHMCCAYSEHVLHR